MPPDRLIIICAARSLLTFGNLTTKLTILAALSKNETDNPNGLFAAGITAELSGYAIAFNLNPNYNDFACSNDLLCPDRLTIICAARSPITSLDSATKLNILACLISAENRQP